MRSHATFETSAMEKPVAVHGLPTPAFAPAAPGGLLFDDYFDNLFEPALGLDGGFNFDSDSPVAGQPPPQQQQQPVAIEGAAAAAAPPPSRRGAAPRRGGGRGGAAGRPTGAPAAVARPPPQRKAARAAAALASADDDDDDEDDDGGDDDDDDDDEGGGGGAGTKRVRSSDPAQRVARSRERNRLHARKSRLRKKFFVDGLRSSVDALEAENQRLRAFAAEKLGLSTEQLDDELSRAYGTAEAARGAGRQAGGTGARASARAAPAAAGAAAAAAGGARLAGASASVLAAPGVKPTAVIESSDFVLIQALTKAQHNFVVSDPSLPDNPIVFASAGFYDLTGYTPSEVVGRNCRFLQGPETDPAAVAIISKGLREGQDTVVCLLNYRKDGSRFYNRFFVAPLRGVDGQIVNFVGVQCEVKESIALELIAKQREAAAQALGSSAAGGAAAGAAYSAEASAATT